MLLILQSFGVRCVLARPKETLLARTYVHFVPFVWMLGAILLMLQMIGVGILLGGVFNRELLFVVPVLCAFPLYVFAFLLAPNPFQEILVTDRSLYWVRWGRVRFWWGVVKFTEIPLESIASIQTKPTLLGQYLGYGDILIRLAAEPGTIQLGYIPNPQQFGSVIQSAMSQVSLLPPIEEIDVLNLDNELQNAYVRQQIDQEEYESAKNELFGQHTL